jgi:hypothetical protein
LAHYASLDPPNNQRTNGVAKQKIKTPLPKGGGRKNTRLSGLPAGYAAFVADLKARVRSAQLRAAVSVNRELILLYWDIGKAIVEAQKTKGYGKQVVERLADDLRKEFPGVAGFSLRKMSGSCAVSFWPGRSFPENSHRL